MFMSLREAGDLCLQITLALTLTMSGMALASTVVKGSQQQVSVIDVNRPSLWSAGPVRIESVVRSDTPGAQEIATGESVPCHSTIGLRISCDLLSFSLSGSF